MRTGNVTSFEPIRTVFFGTPAFAVPTLHRLAGDSRFAVQLVVTQPDRPAGRGRKLTMPAVKIAADHLGLPIYQPESLRSEEARRPIASPRADIYVVAAYGLIFGRRTLEMPRLGCLNLHASLLPRFRGASPVSATILCGDAATGVTLMVMDIGLDTGPMIDSLDFLVDAAATTESLTEQIAAVAAEIAVAAIPRYVAGTTLATPQPEVGVSITRPLRKDDGWLDWSLPAVEVERRVRAMWPWPRAWTTLDREALQIHAADVILGTTHDAPGTVEVTRSDLVVACGRDAVALRTVQPAGARPMAGAALVSGRRMRSGDRLGERGEPSDLPPLIEWIS